MQFALLVYESPEAFATRNDDETDPYLGAWRAYHKALVEAAIYVGGDPLEVPETGTTVRLKEGKPARTGWPLRRYQGATGRIHNPGTPLAGRSPRLGSALPDGLGWCCGGPSARTWLHAPDHGMTGSDQEGTQPTIERVARESYGRLVAYLSSHTRDVASAEDALSEALVAALTTWPRDGVPQNPEAWLLTAARRSLIDLVRHQQVVVASEPTLLLLREDSNEMTLSTEFPDERLKLLFACAHPAIDPAMHTPLMLQTVLGLDAARIAHAFLVSPTTMGQRLVRAKTKIRDGGIQFEVPQEQELPGRLDAVLEAIYAAFGIGWDDMAGTDQRGQDLAEEAIWLARVLLQLMPREAEVRGLLALMLHCEARRPARRAEDGRYVPLSEQDSQQWSLPLIEEAEHHLAEASSRGRTAGFNSRPRFSRYTLSGRAAAGPSGTRSCSFTNN